MDKKMNNVDQKVVDSFGKEWSSYNQQGLSDEERSLMFFQYFDIFPFDLINKNSTGFDAGCGSGRFAKMMATFCGKLYCVDPAKEALAVAKKSLNHLNNVEFINASVDDMPLEESSQDFGYCLGVLHHIPDTLSGLKSCVSKLKKGAPFLLYLYYKFDHKPLWFKIIHKITEFPRFFISRLPHSLKVFFCFWIATFIYLPLAKISLFLKKKEKNISNIPLSAYHNKSFYSMKTDALDRFGTRLEKRFTKKEIEHMMQQAGLKNIKFSDHEPFWCACGIK